MWVLPFFVLHIFTAQFLAPQKLYSCWDRYCNNSFESILTPKGIAIAWWEHRHDDLFVPGPRKICFNFTLPAGASTFAEIFNRTTGKKKRNGTSEPVFDLINCVGILVWFAGGLEQWAEILFPECFILLDVSVAQNSMFQNMPLWHIWFLAIQIKIMQLDLFRLRKFQYFPAYYKIQSLEEENFMLENNLFFFSPHWQELNTEIL